MPEEEINTITQMILENGLENFLQQETDKKKTYYHLKDDLHKNNLLEIQKITHSKQHAWFIRHAFNNKEIALLSCHTGNVEKDIQHSLIHHHHARTARAFLISHTLQTFPQERGSYHWAPNLRVISKIRSCDPKDTLSLPYRLNQGLLDYVRDSALENIDEAMPKIMACMFEITFQLPPSAHERLESLSNYPKLLNIIENNHSPPKSSLQQACISTSKP